MIQRMAALALILLAGSTIPLQAQVPNPQTYMFSLDQCVSYALEHQNSIKNANLDYLESKETVREYLSAGMPQINGKFGVNYFISIPTNLIPAEIFGGPAGTFIPVKFGTSWNYSAGVNIQQLAFDMRYFIGLDGARQYSRLMEKSQGRSKIETVEQVTKAYYNVLVAQERMKLLESSKSQLETLLRETKALLDNGFVQQLDLNRLQVNYNNLETETQKVKALVGLSNEVLKFQMGMPITATVILTDKVSMEDFNPTSIDTTSTLDVTNRIEYQLTEQQLKLNEINVRVEKSTFAPKIYAIGSFQYQGYANNLKDMGKSETWFPNNMLGVQVDVPIFDGLLKVARLRKAQIAVLRSKNDMANLPISLNLQYQQSKIILTNAIRTLEVQQRNMALAEEVYRVTQVKYKEGVGSNLEVVQAETDYKDAKTNYVNSMLEAYLARVDFLKSLGTLYQDK